MNGKIHQSEEDKYRQSLNSWGDIYDNRPFIRVREDKMKDKFDYERKKKKIIEEKKRISSITGDPIESIHLFDSWGHEYSKGGNIREFIPEED